MLGRFISADPLIVNEQKYAELSSYQFAGNKPIVAVDLDGKEEFKVNIYPHKIIITVTKAEVVENSPTGKLVNTYKYDIYGNYTEETSYSFSKEIKNSLKNEYPELVSDKPMKGGYINIIIDNQVKVEPYVVDKDRLVSKVVIKLKPGNFSINPPEKLNLTSENMYYKYPYLIEDPPGSNKGKQISYTYFGREGFYDVNTGQMLLFDENGNIYDANGNKLYDVPKNPNKPLNAPKGYRVIRIFENNKNDSNNKSKTNEKNKARKSK